MIAVVGAGRCGTSLMMQTLDLLGVPLYGTPGSRESHQLWQEWHKLVGIEIPTPISKQHNLKGYYELSVGELKDLIYGTPTTEGAVKFTSLDIVDVLPSKVTHVIHCYREDRDAAALSMYNLSQSDMQYSKGMGYENVFTNSYKFLEPTDWLDHMKRHERLIKGWIKTTALPYIKVKFEDMVTNPEPIIQHLGDFLDMDNLDTSAALKNVEKRCD